MLLLHSATINYFIKSILTVFNYFHLFRATFIVDDDTFWAREKSVDIIDPQAKPLVTPVPMPKVCALFIIHT